MNSESLEYERPFVCLLLALNEYLDINMHERQLEKCRCSSLSVHCTSVSLQHSLVYLRQRTKSLH